MTILDFSTTNAQIVDEVINVSDSNPVNLAHDIFYNKTGKLVVIRTAAAGAGTLLTLTTDYSPSGVFPDGSLPSTISPDVAYTTIAITNATYHDTDLYVSYYPIGDIISAEKYNNLGGSTTVTASATVDQNYVTNVNAATATITIPSGLPIGTRKLVRKISASAGTITIATSGSDVMTRASLTGSTAIKVQLTSNGDFWILEKVTATRWELTDGVEQIVVADSGTNYDRVVKKTKDGEVTVNGRWAAAIDVSTAYGPLYRSAGDIVLFGYTFLATPNITSAHNTSNSVAWHTIRTTTTSQISNLFIVDTSTRTGISFAVTYQATGRWYT